MNENFELVVNRVALDSIELTVYFILKHCQRHLKHELGPEGVDSATFIADVMRHLVKLAQLIPSSHGLFFVKRCPTLEELV